MNKMIRVFIITVIVMLLFSSTYAANFLNNVFNQANNFTNAHPTNNTVGAAVNNVITNGSGGLDLIGVIFKIGNLVVFAVTIALGLKYIYSGIEGKADIKSTLPNYVVGIIFFYSAGAVWELSKNFFTEGVGIGGTFETIEGNAFAILDVIANIFAILGIVLIGLKYMLSSADTRADLKQQLIPMTIGIVFVYCAYNVIKLIYEFGAAIL